MEWLSKRRRRAGKRPALMALLAMLLVVAASAPLALAGARQARADVGSARIVHSADGVLLRAEPTFGAMVITTLPEGANVDLRTNVLDTVYDPDGVTRWWPVRSDVGDGWVAGFFIEIEGLPAASTAALSSPAGPPAESAAEAGTGSATIDAPSSAASAPPGGSATDLHLGGSFARVAEPEGVNLRAEPGPGTDSLASLKIDTVVELRINEADTAWIDGARWWPVRVDGQDGWIIGTYLAPADSGAQAAQAAPAAPAVPDGPAAQVAVDASAAGTVFAPGSYVSARTDEGVGLNIRADGAPDAERIGSIPEYDVVQVMDGPFLDPLGNGWYMISDGAVTGFVDGAWITAATQPGGPDDQLAASAPVAPSPPVNAAGLATGSIGLPAAQFTITQAFGCSPYWWWYPYDANLGCHIHDALDLAAPLYTPLYAADGGVVEYAGWCNCGLGYYVKIDHLNGFKTTYGHMADQPLVQTGQAVSKGQDIGPMGSSGTSTGSHVHFILELNGFPVDPLAFAG
ncbi:MAG: M23 family metallopeptidase [Chloroflexota bacterium]|nr:M23 family metallopeptidase [Chloroflexota bacterium]